MSEPALCSRCAHSGRRWIADDTDRHCALCGQALRTLRIFTPEIGADSEAWTWMVAPEASRASAELRVRNVGSLRVSEFDVDAGPRVQATLGAHALERGVETTLRLEIDAALAREQPTILLQLKGTSFHAEERRLAVRPAPRRLRVSSDVYQAPDAKPGSGLEAERTADVKSENGFLSWTFNRVLVMPWPHSGDAEIHLVPEVAAGERSQELLVATAEWSTTPDGPAAVQVSPSLGAHGGIALGLTSRLAGDAPEVRGEVSVCLRGIGQPQIRIPVLLRSGRPELIPERIPSEQELPGGYPSLMHVAWRWHGKRHQQRGLRARAGPKLIATPSDEAVACHPRRDYTHAQRDELGFLLRVEPPDQKTEVSLELRLVAEVGEGDPPLALSRPHRLALGVETSEHAKRVVQDSVAIDFGTTYTCVVHYGTGETPSDAHPFPHVGESSQPDKVPTTVFVHSASDPANPRVSIGRQALGMRSDSGAEREALPYFELFKPDIGRRPAPPFDVPAGPAYGAPDGHTYFAEDLATFFLRQLVLHMRADLNHRLIEDLHVTYPTTFSARQRKLLEGIVKGLRPYGVVGKCRPLLDEANAGAFKDMNERLGQQDGDDGRKPTNAMIVDFGGGTIDVAVLEAQLVEKDQDAKLYNLSSRGLTGIPDFGGRNVTRLIADKLTEALMMAVPDNKPEDQEKGWVPLKTMAAYRRWAPKLQAIAERNYEFMLLVAEQYKRKFYGTWGPLEVDGKIVLEGEPRWTTKIPKKPGDQWFNPNELGGVQLIELKPYRSQTDFKPQTVVWTKTIRKLHVKREDIDDAIRPALIEVFTRARNLWMEVLRAQDEQLRLRSPDLFILAGNSSMLPLIWEIASTPSTEPHGLGIHAADIRFSRVEAKRMVSRGAALYAAVEEIEGELHIKPEPAHRTVLLPIVRKKGTHLFPDVFQLGTPIPEWNGDESGHSLQPVKRSYAVRGNRLKFQVFESIDHRSEEWPNHDDKEQRKLIKKLKDIGITSKGKQVLDWCYLDLPIREGFACEIEHLIYTRDGRRYMRVRPLPDGGAKELALEGRPEAE